MAGYHRNAVVIDPYGKRELTPKEIRVIELLAQGLKNIEIAREMGTTEFMIKNRNRAIFDKLGLWNRVEVALWWVKDQFDRGLLAKEEKCSGCSCCLKEH